MISVENLTKSFGPQVLFDAVSFKLNARERVGLVGRNGHGKTTLFRMLIGEEQADAGLITVPKNYRLGYVRQQLDFTDDTVLKEAEKGLPEAERDHTWKVEKILAGLGFSQGDLERHPDEFSGGYQVRLNLAKVLVSDPDLLLLDEPTNYLDITSIRWIERFLAAWPRELMLITHDRGFMDKLVTHTIGIHRRKVRKISGNTEKYYAQIAQDEEIFEKTRINDERRRKEIEQFITRFRAKARLANLVQSRVKTLGKMEKHNKLEKIKALDFSFRSCPFSGKFLLNARNISFAHSAGRPLIENLSFALRARDRICVVGKNGKGKTTLLKLLAGIFTPQTGDITTGSGVVQGFYEQTNIASLVDTRTVEEEILFAHADVDRQLARNVCGAMMFEGDNALKKIGVLSGGEKSRVMLGKLLVTPVNLLLLDEPTNHLDMDSCDALLAAIDCFEGAVVMVTHNELFLHALAQRLIVFQNDQVALFEGSYQRFLEKDGWLDERDAHKSGRAELSEKSSVIRLNRKEMRRRRSEIITERSRQLKPLELRIAKVEHAIEKHEKQLNQFNEAMQAVSQAQDAEGIADLSRSIHTCQASIDQLFEELETLTDAFEARNALFEEKLSGLDLTGND